MKRQGLAIATKKVVPRTKNEKPYCSASSMAHWGSLRAHYGRVPREEQLRAIATVLEFDEQATNELLGCFFRLPLPEPTGDEPVDTVVVFKPPVSEPRRGEPASSSVELPGAPWYRRHAYPWATTLATSLVAIALIVLTGLSRDRAGIDGVATCPAVDSLDGTIGLALVTLDDEQCGFKTSLSIEPARISCPDRWLCHVEIVGRGNVIVVGPLDDIEVQGDMTLRFRPSYGPRDAVQDPCLFAEQKAYPRDPDWRRRVVNFACA